MEIDLFEIGRRESIKKDMLTRILYSFFKRMEKIWK